jgi:GT2 family glycosyltransferase
MWGRYHGGISPLQIDGGGRLNSACAAMRLHSRGSMKVAVVIPVYRATYLADALASVFGQTRTPDEVVVVDDGSPDRRDLQTAIDQHASRVRLLTQNNAGAGAARNKGIGATSAELVAFLDADDRWLPRFLERQVAAISAAPGIDLVYSDGLFIGQSALSGRKFTSACPSSERVTFEQLLSQQSTVLLSAVVARRAAILDVGGFDESLRRGQDFDLWLRMARNGAAMRWSRDVLALRRVHADNLSGDAITELERPLRVFEKTVATMPLSPRELAIATTRMRVLKAALARERGKDMLRRGDIAAARTAFDEARAGLHAWKLHAAAMGLRIAPHLVRRFYLSRAAFG